MTKNPYLSFDLYKKIKAVRRDLGDLLFHFTRRKGKLSSFQILINILTEQQLVGTGTWSDNQKVVCFTEAPINEFNSIFTLNTILKKNEEKPRYEPYGIAVPKKWLYQKGGRPVIYDNKEILEILPEEMKYRFVEYNPEKNIDYTWEREWRIKTDFLKLDPKVTLVIVPTAEEAFEIVYNFSKLEPEYDIEHSTGEYSVSGVYHYPQWLAVSLDIFGFEYENE